MTDPWRERREIGDATLYLGDCQEILPALGKVDAVVTDPPYGVRLGNHAGAGDTRRTHVLNKPGYENYDDTEDNPKKIVVPACSMALSGAQRGAIFCADRNLWNMPQATAVGGVYIPAAQGRCSWGFSSLSHVLFYGKAPNQHLGAKATVLYSSATAEKNGHPCPKPVEWMLWAVNRASLPGETVIDPFMGSGTTGVACARLGRCFIGIEIEEKYFRIACKRIEDAQRQGRLFDDKLAHPTQMTIELAGEGA